MLFKWPIRTKLFACLGLLLVIVGLLSWGGISGLYAYRDLVRSLSRRVPELPLANQFSQNISELRIALNESRTSRELELTGHEVSPLATHLARQEFRTKVQAARETLEKYRRQLLDNPANSRIGDSRQEWMTVQAIQESLARVDHANLDEDWLLDEIRVGKLTNELEYLQQLAAELPSYLYKKINDFTEEARVQYRSLIILTMATTIVALIMFAGFMERFYTWIFRPLRILVRRFAQSGQRTLRLPHPPQDARRNVRAGAGHERHDRPVPGHSRRFGPAGSGALEGSHPQRTVGQRRLPGCGRGARNQQPAGRDRAVRRFARGTRRRAA